MGGVFHPKRWANRGYREAEIESGGIGVTIIDDIKAERYLIAGPSTTCGGRAPLYYQKCSKEADERKVHHNIIKNYLAPSKYPVNALVVRKVGETLKDLDMSSCWKP